MKQKKIKVVTIVGTRPEIIKLSSVMKELDKYTDHIIVHTGQNYDYELNEIFFKDLGLRKPDYFLNAAGASSAQTVGTCIIKMDEVYEKEKPDATLILGDTNSCMSIYAAKRRKIPIFHMEAGNRCFDDRVPEELNRRMIDHISDVNLVYSERARQNLLREAIESDRIFRTGSPMFEVLSGAMKKIESSDVIKRLKLQPKKYFVLSSHREENVDSEENLMKLVKVIEAVSTAYTMPIVFSMHPRTQKRIAAAGITLPKNVMAMKPLGLNDYVHLEKNAFCVLSDSGTISEESSILNFPALNIRMTHERQEAMDEATVIMTGLNAERVLQALEVVKDQARGSKRDVGPVAEYNFPNVSKKVVRIILSYIDYVRRKTWSMEI